MPAESYDTKKWMRLIDINLTGSYLMAQSVGKHMIAANKPGSIIFIASMSGSIVNYPQEQSCYNASKAGVIQLGKSLAAEWAKYGIRVNCISPGKHPCSRFSFSLPPRSSLKPSGITPYSLFLDPNFQTHPISVQSLTLLTIGYMDTALNNVPALDAQKKIWRSLTPQNRLGAVEDLNGLAVLLASDASAFMTGSNVIIDGGYTLY